MSLYRSFATVGGLTLASRVLGFVRDIIFAAVLGAGPIAEAFVVAFRFPNLFRRWFGEGAFNAAFIPLYAKVRNGDGTDAERRQAASQFASEVLSALLALLVVLSALCMLAMPWLMYGLAPGFAADPKKFDLAVVMSQIAFPYLMCMSLVALLSGILNSLGRFVASSAISIVLNLVLIAAMLIAMALGHRNNPTAGLIMAWGIFVAGLLQLGMLIWAAARSGVLPRLRLPRITPGVRNLVRLGVPGIIAGGATQINIVIGGMIASLQAGAVSYLYYADRLYELPLAIIGIAIGVVLLPDIARHVRGGDQQAALDTQNRGLEFAMFFTLPAAVALAVMPGPIISVLFERGAFRQADTEAVAAALAFFAIGLPAFVAIKVFQPAYFAREDTKTPMRFAAISFAVNTAGSIALFFAFKAAGLMPHVGIAIATTVGAWLNAGQLWSTLRARGHFKMDARIRRSLPVIVIASVAMGAALWFAAGQIEPWLGRGSPLWQRSAALALLITAASLFYFAIAMLLGGIRPSDIKAAIRRQRQPPAEKPVPEKIKSD
jgi:putative peptidoglycan lipid II flippase